MSHVPKSFERVAKYFPDDYLDNDQGGLPKQEYGLLILIMSFMPIINYNLEDLPINF